MAESNDPVTLTLVAVKPVATEGEPTQLRLVFTAVRPVTLFHRLVSGWAPDELELVIRGPSGERVSGRVILTAPEKTPVRHDDFVTLSAGQTLAFAFPAWADAPFAPGEWSFRARYVGGADRYVDDTGEVRLVRDVFSGPVESNPVAVRIVPR